MLFYSILTHVHGPCQTDPASASDTDGLVLQEVLLPAGAQVDLGSLSTACPFFFFFTA